MSPTPNEELRDRLHDEIDEKEELGEAARDVVMRLKGKLVELVRETGDTVAAMEALAVLAEDELDGLTTTAVQRGWAAGERRPL